MSKLGTLGARLHRGEVSYDFVGNRKIWYGISILITITAILGLAVRGLNMGIEFQGGAVFTTEKTSVSVSQARTYAQEASGHDAIVQKLGNGALRIQIAGIDTEQSDADQGASSPRTSRSTRRRSTPTWSAPAGATRSPTRPGRAWRSSWSWS